MTVWFENKVKGKFSNIVTWSLQGVSKGKMFLNKQKNPHNLHL